MWFFFLFLCKFCELSGKQRIDYTTPIQIAMQWTWMGFAGGQERLIDADSCPGQRGGGRCHRSPSCWRETRRCQFSCHILEPIQMGRAQPRTKCRHTAVVRAVHVLCLILNMSTFVMQAHCMCWVPRRWWCDASAGWEPSSRLLTTWYFLMTFQDFVVSEAHWDWCGYSFEETSQFFFSPLPCLAKQKRQLWTFWADFEATYNEEDLF